MASNSESVTFISQKYSWWFPAVGVPLFIIHFNEIFDYQPTILDTPIHGNPQNKIVKGGYWDSLCQYVACSGFYVFDRCFFLYL